jgi:hypothetical protein
LSVLAYRLGNGQVNLAVIPAGCLAGGAIAGWSLRRGWVAVGAFAVSYAVAIPILLIGAIGIQGLGGSGIFLVPVFGFIPFAIVGGFGVALAGLGGRQALRSAVEFGLAGVVGCLLFMIGIPLLTMGSFAFLVLPFAVGGTRLMQRLASRVARAADTPIPS